VREYKGENMKFSEMPYKRVTVETVKELCEKEIEAIKNAKSAEEIRDIIYAADLQSREFDTYQSLAQVRAEINTKDEFYKAEMEYMDENGPIMQLYAKQVTDTILDSPFLKDLEPLLGSLFIKQLETHRKLFSEAIIPDKQEENKLTTRYSEILGGAEIEFDGKIVNLTQLAPYQQSSDREVRKAAGAAYWGFFTEHQQELDEIYDKLVKLRDSMAKKLGFPSYVEMGYLRMERFDYNEEMVSVYREEILKYIVPLVNELKERQAKRIGVEGDFKFYDNAFMFKTGNPKPKGTPEDLVEEARKMYHELSPESGEFFDFMVENELLDLVAKPGKMTGGFCTCFPSYKAPFIFSNFTGTKDDVDVLTHEAGHALQCFLSMKEIPLSNFWWPTSESAEIHSMSMELITRPWMKPFFKEDTEKFLYQQLEDPLYFLPYGILVDHFQHHVYRNPDEGPEARAKAWRDLEKQYLPYIDFDGYEYLESGRRWQRQAHIFQSPFYYVDYTLAQVCAMQFFLRFNGGDESAWGDYLKLCKAGGTKTFLSLVELAGLKSPFERGVLDGAAKELKKILDATDDSAF